MGGNEPFYGHKPEELCTCSGAAGNVMLVSSRVVLRSESRSPVEMMSGQLSSIFSFPAYKVQVILQLRDIIQLESLLNPIMLHGQRPLSSQSPALSMNLERYS